MLKKPAVPLSLVALATLAACAAGPGRNDTVVTNTPQPGYVQGGTVPPGYVISGYVQPSFTQPTYERVAYVPPANGQPGYYTGYNGPAPVPGGARTGKGKIVVLSDLSGPVANISTQRATLRMDDNSVQTIDVRGVQLRQGEEIRIGQDSSIRREPSN